MARKKILPRVQTLLALAKVKESDFADLDTRELQLQRAGKFLARLKQEELSKHNHWVCQSASSVLLAFAVVRFNLASKRADLLSVEAIY